MTPKLGALKQRHRIDEALSFLVVDLSTVPGVYSIYVQYGSATAILVALVESDYAKRLARKVEREHFLRSPATPIDLHIQTIPATELALEEEALATAYARLWPDDDIDPR